MNPRGVQCVLHTTLKLLFARSSSHPTPGRIVVSGFGFSMKIILVSRGSGSTGDVAPFDDQPVVGVFAGIGVSGAEEQILDVPVYLPGNPCDLVDL